MTILTPEQAAALEDAAATIKKLAEALNEFVESKKEDYADFLEKIEKCVEIPEREKYTPCRKIGFSQPPQIPAKQWRKNRALFRPYKRGV